jgi:hypothetical protein
VGENEFAPFLNIMSEWYARDTSRKIKAVLHSKAKSGKHMTNPVIYGYRKHPDDKDKWIIDEEAAAVVRRIYQMAVGGMGTFRIAKTLTDEKVLRPSVYIALRDGGTYTPATTSDPYTWWYATVRDILRHREYTGCTVNFKTYKDSYKDRKAKLRPEEEWIVFEGTQEPIVDPNTWQTAQKCLKTMRRPNSNGTPNPLTGLVYCADCGHRMHNHMGARAAKHDSQDTYVCNQYNNTYPRKCSMHYIKTSVLRALVRDTIKQVSAFARGDEENFVKLVREESELQSAETVKTHKERLAKSERRHAELNGLIKRLYEDTVSGRLSEKRFEILSGEYEDEQENLENQIAELRAALEHYKEDSGRAEKFLEIVRRYTDFTELTPAMLNEFVDKIVVHEAVRTNGRRTQQVNIFLNFVGKLDIDLPRQEETEAEPFDPVEHKRAQWRKYYYKKRERMLAEKGTSGETDSGAGKIQIETGTEEMVEDNLVI